MLDTNHNGQIEFSEFKAAMLRTSIYLQQEQINKVFQFFDKDQNGTITQGELKCVFETNPDLFNMFSTNDYDAIIAQADLNHDGKISYEEFVQFTTADFQEHDFLL